MQTLEELDLVVTVAKGSWVKFVKNLHDNRRLKIFKNRYNGGGSIPNISPFNGLGKFESLFAIIWSNVIFCYKLVHKVTQEVKED